MHICFFNIRNNYRASTVVRFPGACIRHQTRCAAPSQTLRAASCRIDHHHTASVVQLVDDYCVTIRQWRFTMWSLPMRHRAEQAVSIQTSAFTHFVVSFSMLSGVHFFLCRLRGVAYISKFHRIRLSHNCVADTEVF